MNPRPTRLVAVAIVALAAAIFGAGYLASTRFYSGRWRSGVDELDWLRTEFRLGDSEMARIRTLHEGYRPACQAMCDRIAAKKTELRNELASSDRLSSAAREKLNEVAALRAQCQAQMLEHFEAVSREMPLEQGRRYLAAMREQTLGVHERVEDSMAGGKTHRHGGGSDHAHD
jgi:hypothetical protein